MRLCAEIVTEIQYIQDLTCSEEGNFDVSIPLTVPAEQMFNGMTMNDILQEVSVKINTGNNDGSWGSLSHSFEMSGPPGELLAMSTM